MDLQYETYFDKEMPCRSEYQVPGLSLFISRKRVAI